MFINFYYVFIFFIVYCDALILFRKVKRKKGAIFVA